ncbi:MAG TPA: hypothetical protein VI796_01050 [Candidatus Thermoplasmatota archaeon]|nr:hypothetical protein [Candidatus Thermoplasmatota archaeon]
MPGRPPPAATPVLLLALAAALLAGCSGGGASGPTAEPTPALVTDPADFGDSTAVPHIHDYWHGGDRLVVLNVSHPGGQEEGAGPGLAAGEAVPVMAFRPAGGDVVPQGTAVVEVTVSWTDAAGDQHRDPELWVKSAADNATRAVGPIENGARVVVSAVAADADLPHQQLSAWVFELRMSSPDPLPLRFKGSVTMEAEAVRGLELPVFPAHPDRWGGEETMPLVAYDGLLEYAEDPIDHGCNGSACPTPVAPDSGRIVPRDATYVVVVLDTQAGGTPVDLFTHSAAIREFTLRDPTEGSGDLRTYRIPVATEGDGPYALQSQWAFLVLPSPDLPFEAAANVAYTLTATVTRMA